MAIVTRHSLLTVLVLALVAVFATGLFIWFGVYNISADDTHSRPVYAILETLRERSIEARSKELHPPRTWTILNASAAAPATTP